MGRKIRAPRKERSLATHSEVEGTIVYYSAILFLGIYPRETHTHCELDFTYGNILQSYGFFYS